MLQCVPTIPNLLNWYVLHCILHSCEHGWADTWIVPRALIWHNSDCFFPHAHGVYGPEAHGESGYNGGSRVTGNEYRQVSKILYNNIHTGQSSLQALKLFRDPQKHTKTQEYRHGTYVQYTHIHRSISVGSSSYLQSSAKIYNQHSTAQRRPRWSRLY